MKAYALLSSQGTVCNETTLYENEYTDENRKKMENRIWPGHYSDAPVAGTWTEIPYDVAGAIIAYEQGDLSDEATIELFQHLVDIGMAWTLQGHYGRTARALIDAGLVSTGSGQALVAEAIDTIERESSHAD